MTNTIKQQENLLSEYGIPEPEIEDRLTQAWNALFDGPEQVYGEDEHGGYVVDTGNHDVRTEGMSYAMMAAIQYDRRDVFDKLWSWAWHNMLMYSGPTKGYFAWSVSPRGVKNSTGPAPDGEEYFAMDLLLASRRWGEQEYATQARDLLATVLHQGEDGNGGRPMWDPSNHLIRFIPEVDWTDPSYHLPHFYENFALVAQPEDRAFWEQAAQASRAFLKTAMNPQTGLNPEYSTFTGEPKTDTEHPNFFSDAYRTGANIGLDCLWNGPDPVLCDRDAALQKFLRTHDCSHAYTVDGTPLTLATLHPVGLIATTAEASIAARHSALPGAEETARWWVRTFWETPLRTGDRRYYDNFLYLFALLALSGRYQENW